MKGIAFAEVMPDAGEYAKTVADDRTEYDAGHTHKIGQYHGKKNIAADPETWEERNASDVQDKTGGSLAAVQLSASMDICIIWPIKAIAII